MIADHLLFGGEDFETSREATEQIGRIISDHHLDRGLLYDLGSCRGDFALNLNRACPSLRIVGIDYSLVRTWFARLWSVGINALTFLKADLFDVDVSAADICFIYLPRPMMPSIEAKLQREMKPGSLVITYRVFLPTWRAKQEGDIFVYQK